MPEHAVLPKSVTHYRTNLNNRVLGFDFGMSRIGVATGNIHLKTCQAITTLSSKNGDPLWHEIFALIDEWKPSGLVVGLPLSMNGEENEMTALARKFGAALENKTGYCVTFVDERLSSRAADHLLDQSSVPGKRSRKRNKDARDSLAAELILRTYFDDN